MITVKTNGRTAGEDFFEMSGIREVEKAKHYPFLLFYKSGEEVEVRIIPDPKMLLSYDADTQVMAQWKGKSRSDFFKFTVGDLVNHIKENPAKQCQRI